MAAMRGLQLVVNPSELGSLCQQLHASLQSQQSYANPAMPSSWVLLRKLHSVLICTVYKPAYLYGSLSGHSGQLRNLCHRLVRDLYTVLVGADQFAPAKVRLLCVAVMKDLAVALKSDFDGDKAVPIPDFFLRNLTGNFSGYDLSKVCYVLQLLTSLHAPELLMQNVPNLVRWALPRRTSLDSGSLSVTRSAMAALLCVCELLDGPAVEAVEDSFAHYLLSASVHFVHTTNTSILGLKLFSSTSLQPILEPHGGPCRDFFTCVNVANTYKPDQLVNVHVFSQLFSWVLHRCLLARESVNDGLRSAIVTYCKRVLGQLEHATCNSVGWIRLGRSSGVSEQSWTLELYDAVASEAVRVLDLLTCLHPSLASVVFPDIQALYQRSGSTSLIFPSVVQFVVNHCPEYSTAVLHDYFVNYVSLNYRKHLVAMNCVLFLAASVSKLPSEVFTRYYPSILKLLAYHPRTLADEVIPLLGPMLGPTTFVELFHTLLDLPLTAVFMEQYERPVTFSSAIADGQLPDRSLQAVQKYVMRDEAGGQPCVWDKSDMLMTSVWNCSVVTSRVSAVCKLVPRSLNVYFTIFLQDAPEHCIEHLVVLLLRRFSCLFPVESQAVQALLSRTLLTIFEYWPHFLARLKQEIVAAMSAHLNCQGVRLVQDLCWIIGEHTNPHLYPYWQPQDVVDCYEALEALAYEAVATVGVICAADHGRSMDGTRDWRQHDERLYASDERVFSAQFVCVVVTALTKVGLNFPTYAPRVALCVAKVRDEGDNITPRSLRRLNAKPEFHISQRVSSIRSQRVFSSHNNNHHCMQMHRYFGNLRSFSPAWVSLREQLSKSLQVSGGGSTHEYYYHHHPARNKEIWSVQLFSLSSASSSSSTSSSSSSSAAHPRMLSIGDVAKQAPAWHQQLFPQRVEPFV